MADTAKFVITGEFDSAALLASISAAFGRIGRVIQKELDKAVAPANAAVVGGVSQATRAAAKQEMAERGIATKSKETAQNKEKTKNAMDRINADLFTAVKRVVLWGAASRLVFQTFQKIGDAVKDVVTLNKFLTDIVKIRPQGLPVFKIESNILQTAKDFGIAFDEIAATQKTFFQQGYSVAQVAELTRVQLLGITAAGLSASESIELLIGSMSVFKIEAEKSVEILDKLQKVQANFPVSTQDLATALRRVGPVVEQLGGDIDHLIGVITSLKEATRKSGEFIGTALSTIFSRMITPVGANALMRIGVDINRTAQEIRPLQDILNDLARAWGGLSDQQKISTAFALGARRRYAQVIALMNNYQTVIDASTASASSFGASLIAQQKELQSVSRQMSIVSQKAREAGMAIIHAFLGSGGRAEDTMRAFAQRLQSLADGFKGASRAIGIFGKAIVIWAPIATVGLTVATLGTRLSQLNVQFKLASAGALGFSGAMRTLSTVVGATTASLGLIGLVGTIALSVYHFFKAKKSADDASKAFKDFAEQAEDVKEVLRQYAAVTEQFQAFKGPELLDKFLGTGRKGDIGSVIGEMSRLSHVSGDLSQVTLDDFADSIERVTGKTPDLAKSVEELGVVLGYIETTQRGLAKAFEQVRSDMLELQTAFSTATVEIQAGTEHGIKYLFGLSPEEFQKEIRNFRGGIASISSSLDPNSIVFDESQIKRLGKKLFDVATDANAAFLAAFETLGPEVQDRVQVAFDNLARSIAEGQVVDDAVKALNKSLYTGGISSNLDVELDLSNVKIDQEALYNGISDGLKAMLGPAVMKDFLKEAIGTPIEILQLVGGGGTPEAKALLGDIENIFGKEFAAAMKEIEKELLPLREKVRDAYVSLNNELVTKGIGTIPKKMSSALKAIIKFNASMESMDDRLAHTALQAQIMGTSFAQAAVKLNKSKIEEALKALSKRRGRLAEIQDESKEIQHQIQLIKDQGEGDKRAIQADDYAKILQRLTIEYSNIQAEMSEIDRLSQETLAHINNMVSENNRLRTQLVAITETYKVRNALLTASVSNYKALVSESTKFQKAVSKGRKEIADMLDPSPAGKLANAMDMIQRNLSISLGMNDKMLEAEHQRYAQALNNLQVKRDELEELESMIEVEGSIEGVIEGVSDKRLKELAAILRTHEVNKANLEAERERLAIGAYYEAKLAQQNALLAQAKMHMADINNLASGLASAVGDVVTNSREIFRGEGGLGKLLEPFADAYAKSVADRLTSSLESVMQDIASRALGDPLDKLEEQMKALQDQQTGIRIGVTIADKMLAYSPEMGRLMGLGLATVIAELPGMGDKVNVADIDAKTRSKLPSGEGIAIERGSLQPIVGSITDLIKIAQEATKIDNASLTEQQKAAEKQRLTVAAIQGLGLTLGNVLGLDPQGSNIGSGIGGLAASIAFAGNPVAGAIGSALGGIVGGLFGKKDKPEEPDLRPVLYENNTDALKANTEATLKNTQSFEFMRRLINAPSNFVLPTGASLGGAGVVAPQLSVTINGNVTNADDVYDAVSNAYSDSYRRIGRRG